MAVQDGTSAVKILYGIQWLMNMLISENSV